MDKKVRVYLDSSALFAGIWSPTGGARMILKLAEAEAIHIIISSQVLTEVESALREKAPHTLGTLALLLDRSNAEIASQASTQAIKECKKLVRHPGDVKVLAGAWTTDPDFFVTLDRKHFIKNQALQDVVPFPIGTPGDFLDWFPSFLISASHDN